MNLILDLFFPKRCVGCGKFDTYFCEECILQIGQSDLVCPKCERPSIGGATHPVCRRKFGLDGLWFLGVYQKPLSSAIRQLKYQPKLVRELAPVLVDLILEYWVKYQPFVFDQIKKDQGVGWVVVSVPLHWFRENQRGFNQVSLIGQLLSKKLGLGFCESIKRTRFTSPQAKLKGRQRSQNIKGAFEITNYYEPLTMNNVLLIDDVWTTGSTLRECCFVLKRAGAKKVWALTIAR